MWDPPGNALSLACLRKRTAFSQKQFYNHKNWLEFDGGKRQLISPRSPRERDSPGKWKLLFVSMASPCSQLLPSAPWSQGLRLPPSRCVRNFPSPRLHRAVPSADFPPLAAPSHFSIAIGLILQGRAWIPLPLWDHMETEVSRLNLPLFSYRYYTRC